MQQVEVDFATCDRLAEVLASVSIPEDREDRVLADFSRDAIGNFYVLLVAICHQTQSLEGKVGDTACRGWDYLSRKLEESARADGNNIEPTRWVTVSEEDVRMWFRDPERGETLSDPGGRALLIQNLGSVMRESGWSCLDDLHRLAEGRVDSGTPSLLRLLASFRAYDDPVRKKSLFLLGLMANGGLWTYVDENRFGPPVDYHEVRGHLRIGTVVVADEGLRRKLLTGEPVSEADDVSIRLAVYDAIMHIASRPGLPSPMRLHYLFWNVFRTVCRRQDPYCRRCPGTLALPDRYTHLVELRQGQRQCPFVEICQSPDRSERFLEHSFKTDWY